MRGTLIGKCRTKMEKQLLELQNQYHCSLDGTVFFVSGSRLLLFVELHEYGLMSADKILYHICILKCICSFKMSF